MDTSKRCSCSEVHISVHEILNKELSAAEYARLREHVQSCVKCQKIIAQEAELRELLQKCCSCEAPQTLKARIQYSIKVSTQRTITE